MEENKEAVELAVIKAEKIIDTAIKIKKDKELNEEKVIEIENKKEIINNKEEESKEIRNNKEEESKEIIEGGENIIKEVKINKKKSENLNKKLKNILQELKEL